MKFSSYLIDQAFKLESFDNLEESFITGMNLLMADKGEDVKFVLLNTEDPLKDKSQDFVAQGLLQGQTLDKGDKIICILIGKSPLPGLMAHAEAACIDRSSQVIYTTPSMYVPAETNPALFGADVPDESISTPLFDDQRRLLAYQILLTEENIRILQSIAPFQIEHSPLPRQLVTVKDSPREENNCMLWSIINAFCFYKGLASPSVALNKEAIQKGHLLEDFPDKKLLEDVKATMVQAFEAFLKNYFDALSPDQVEKSPEPWDEAMREIVSQNLEAFKEICLQKELENQEAMDPQEFGSLSATFYLMHNDLDKSLYWLEGEYFLDRFNSLFQSASASQSNKSN